MRRLFKIIFLAVILIEAVLGSSIKTEAAASWDNGSKEKMTKGAFTYHYLTTKDKKKCWIYKVTIDSNKGSTKVLVFPSKINKIPVTRLGVLEPIEPVDEAMISEGEETIFGTLVEDFHDYAETLKEIDCIKEMFLPASLEEINDACFAGMKGIEKILIPDKVTRINRLIFYKCDRLEEVKLPAAMKKFETKAFMSCKRLKKISLPKQNGNYRCSHGMVCSKGGKVLYWVAPGMKGTVKVPGKITKIKENAMSECKANKVIIGENVKSIAAHALDISTLKTIQLSKKNKQYGYDKRCIYSKVSGRLVVGIVYKEKLTISNKVTVLKKKASVAGGYVSKLVVPKSVKRLETDWMEMFSDNPKRLYFKGMTPPVVEGSAQVPVFAKYYVPKKALPAYLKWAKKNNVLEDNEFFGV